MLNHWEGIEIKYLVVQDWERKIIMGNLLGMVFVIIIIMLFIWSYILLPEKIEKAIKREILEVSGQIICIRNLNRNIYLVEYMKDNVYIQRNIKSNLLGNIEWI